MIATSFRAMGTAWWIHCDRAQDLASAEALVHALEARLSRFAPDSALSQLNRDRQGSCPVLAAVTRRALELRAGTGGAFDPTLGADLVALGYDRSFERLDRHRRHAPASPTSPASIPDTPTPQASTPPVSTQPNTARTPTVVQVDAERVTLLGPGHLDLGGIAKGYAVDRVVDHLLERGATSVLVDGGGDLRGAGPSFPIGVGDGLVIGSRLGAVATSSTRKRRWLGPEHQLVHHLIDPATGRSSDGPLDTATVVAPDAATADALATALLVDAERVLPRLLTFGAHALVRARDGRWWTTPGAPFEVPFTPIVSAAPPRWRPSRPRRPESP